jgi:tetratricopeptide (TPR) repeat protein
LPGIYYAAPFIAIAIVAIPLYLTYKFNRKYFRIVGFGFGFFIANVIFVLQFISVGAAIMADRYSYVAYIGLFFMVAWFLYEATQKFPNIKSALVTVALLLSGILSYLCYERTYAWHDSETLLTDAIEKYPYRALLSYKWLGNYYFSIGELDKALENYELLNTIHAADKKVLENIAKINNIKAGGFIPPTPQMTGAPLNAPEPQQNAGPNIYIDSVIAYSKTGDTVSAFKAYIKAIRQNTGSEKVLADSSFMFVQVKRFNEAIGIYTVLLKINTSNPFYYFYRGVAKFSLNYTKEAMVDWEIAVKYDNRDVKQSASYNLGVAYESFGDAKKALMYVEMAQKAGYNVSSEYMNKLKAAAAKK